MRWTYLITRFLILGLILAAIWIGKDPLVRLALIRSGESTTGAKIEVAQVRTSVWNGKIYLRDIAISDPRDPMRNLLQADVAFVELDPFRLLHREFVVERGSSSQVLFGAPRTTSGKLGNATASIEPVPIDGELSSSQNRDKPTPTRSMQPWRNQFAGGPHTVDQKQLELTRVSIQQEKRWPKILREQRAKVAQLQRELKLALETAQNKAQENAIQSVRSRTNQNLNAQGNSLRAPKTIAPKTENLTKLNSDRDRIRLELKQLMKQALVDQQDIRDAKKHDTTKLNSMAAQPTFGDELVNRTLLAEYQQRYANEVLQWFKWFRDSLPNPEADFREQSYSGVDVVFDPDASLRPQFLIKEIDLDGEGKIAGQLFNFSGVAKNITTEPRSHDQPTTIQLRAQGKSQIVVECMLDRRDELAFDTLNIHSPGLPLPEQQIGRANDLLVDVSGCRLQSDINLVFKDGQLSGELVFRHSNLLLQIADLEENAGGQELADAINLDLALLNSFEVRAELSGTLDAPKIKFQSDLGAQFATVMNRVAAKRRTRDHESLMAKFENLYAEELNGFQVTVLNGINDLSGVLEKTSGPIAEIARLNDSSTKHDGRQDKRLKR